MPKAAQPKRHMFKQHASGFLRCVVASVVLAVVMPLFFAAPPSLHFAQVEGAVKYTELFHSALPSLSPVATLVPSLSVKTGPALKD